MFSGIKRCAFGLGSALSPSYMLAIEISRRLD
jgi:hypothetical protein